MFRFLTALVFCAAPAWANDGCHDLWFTRNLIMDRAGYCFGSVLGQAVFDNADSTGTSVSLPPGQQQMVAALREMERRFECHVNTGQPWLHLNDRAVRQRLTDLPIRDEFESACLGWLGPLAPLRAGHHPGSDVLNYVSPGDWVSYSHIPVGPWTYVTIHLPDWTLKGGGWLDTSAQEEVCSDYAG